MLFRSAAEVDIFSNGRLRLGVGVGWKEQEFDALGVDFHSRGRLIEEQVSLLKELWTKEKVNYSGTFHVLKNIGINLLPIQQPIPIWMGGSADRVLRRAARLADDWITDQAVSKDLNRYIGKVWNYLDQFEKDKHDFKIIKYLQTGKIPRSEWL